MDGFVVKTVSLLAILGVLSGYDLVLEDREREETLAQLSAQVEAMEGYIQDSQKAAAGGVREDGEDGLYADGEWEGKAQGFGGEIVLKVTVKEGVIADISIISAAKEDEAYLSMAETMLPAIMEAQSAEVDTVTGATFSSTGIKNAAAQALEKAER